MITEKLRYLLVLVVLCMMMVMGSALPVAAQGVQKWTPTPIGCVFQGKTYPLGTVLHFVLPYPSRQTCICAVNWSIPDCPTQVCLPSGSFTTVNPNRR